MKKPSAHIASFDVDPQKGFTSLCPNELPVEGGDEIVPMLNYMASLASIRVASKDAHSPDAPWVVNAHSEMFRPTGMVDADLTWVRHCIPGTKGFEFLDGLSEEDYRFIVWKGIDPKYHPYGACYHDIQERLSTGVIEFLKSEGITMVLVGGLATDYCVKTTAIQLAEAGFKVVVYLEACRAIAPETELKAIEEMLAVGIIPVTDKQTLTILAEDHI
ncbi:nicotinamidase [Pseudomonas luteola]